MDKKNKLLSIGEFSKIGGASIKSLRYYDRINILKPVYVDLDSGYRYYAYNQVYLLEILQFAIELDIPLREISGFTNGQDIVDLSAFGVYAQEAAQKKISTLQKGLKFIDFFAQRLMDKYPFGSVYTREFPKKHFCVVPYEKTFEEADPVEVAKLILGAPYYEVVADDYINEALEYGMLCEYSPAGIRRYVFMQVPGELAKSDCKVIPGGEYHCRISDANQIEQAGTIFKDYLKEKDSFIAIETEVFFSGKFNINKPINELRVILGG